MAVGLINEVGPVPGNFLGEEHTRDWWRKECYLPSAADRLPISDWIKKGKKKAMNHARERMEDILQNYKITPLPDLPILLKAGGIKYAFDIEGTYKNGNIA